LAAVEQLAYGLWGVPKMRAAGPCPHPLPYLSQLFKAIHCHTPYRRQPHTMLPGHPTLKPVWLDRSRQGCYNNWAKYEVFWVPWKRAPAQRPGLSLTVEDAKAFTGCRGEEADSFPAL